MEGVGAAGCAGAEGCVAPREREHERAYVLLFAAAEDGVYCQAVRQEAQAAHGVHSFRLKHVGANAIVHTVDDFAAVLDPAAGVCQLPSLGGVTGDIVEVEGVGLCVEAPLGRAFYPQSRRGECQRQRHCQRVHAGATADASNETYKVGAGLPVPGPCMVGVRAVAVAEVPYRIFHTFSRAYGGHSVHRHCAVVHECHIETTLCRRYLVSHQGQGEACAGKGAHGELARGVVDEREVAEVGDVVVRRHGDFLPCRQSLRGVVGGVPPVVESRGHGEVVFLDDAAAGRHHAFVSAFQGEVGIAVVRTFVAVARCQADVDGLTRVGSEVDADGGPVFPEHIVVGLVPPHVVVGDEVGASAGRVHYHHVLVE